MFPWPILTALCSTFNLALNIYCIADLFRPAKVSFFSFSNLQKRKLNAQSRSIRVGVVCVIAVKAKKQTMSDFPLKHGNLVGRNKSAIR